MRAGLQFGMPHANARLSVRTIATELEARLTLSGDGGPAGKAEWKIYGSGDKGLKLKARNLPVVDGDSVAVHVAASVVEDDVIVEGGRGRLRLDSRHGDDVPEIRAWDTIVLRAAGRDIANGYFAPD